MHNDAFLLRMFPTHELNLTRVMVYLDRAGLVRVLMLIDERALKLRPFKIIVTEELKENCVMISKLRISEGD